MNKDKLFDCIKKAKNEAQQNHNFEVTKDGETVSHVDCYGIEYVVSNDCVADLGGLNYLKKALDEFLDEQELEDYNSRVWVENHSQVQQIKSYQKIFVGVIQ